MEGLDEMRGDAQKGGGHGGLQELGAAKGRPHPGVRVQLLQPSPGTPFLVPATTPSSHWTRPPRGPSSKNVRRAL